MKFTTEDGITYEVFDSGLIRQVTQIAPPKYGKEYVQQRYLTYDERPMSVLRYTLMRSFTEGKSILDIGPGSGAFLNECEGYDRYAFDVGDAPLPDGIIKIPELEGKFDIVTMFDSLEHFENIESLFEVEFEYAIVSVPCRPDISQFDSWKHRRPGEHLWHFNERSLSKFFVQYGYAPVYTGDIEDHIRKDDRYHPNILTAVFKRS